MKLLNKSDYLIGLKCLKSLWIEKNQKEKIREKSSTFGEILKEEGEEIEKMARRYFKSPSIDITKKCSPNKNSLSKQIKYSTDCLTKNSILFRPKFATENLTSKIDILKPFKDKTFELIEVTSSTNIKSEHIDSVAFQYFVCRKAGVDVCKCHLLYPNKEYTLQEKLNLEKFLRLKEITQKVLEKQNEVKLNTQKFTKIISSEEFEDICLNKRKCHHKNIITPKISEYELYTLTRITEKKLKKLQDENIQSLKNINSSHSLLTDAQKIQLKALHSPKKYYINSDPINNILKKLTYPLYFMDFETIFSAIPIYFKTKPYQHIPFQFSLHIQTTKNSNLLHKEFLATSKKDPRQDFLKNLLKLTQQDRGSIIVYYEAFEKKILRDLAKNFPEFKKQINSLLERIFDLHKIFSGFHYYHSKQKGSTSIKEVFPILCPEFSYSHLTISNGAECVVSFKKLIQNELIKEEREELIKDLKEYCKLDTLAMVKILEKTKLLL